MGKKAGNRKHSKIDALDPALRETVEQMLLSGSTYSEIVDFLGENGVGISVASVCRYAKAYQAEVQMLNMAQENFPRRANIQGYRLADGRTLNVLAEGRLVNLAAGNGHPAEIMDMSFAVQALSLEWLARHKDTLEKKVYQVPDEIDDQIGRVKLAAMGLAIDQLTQEQKDYLAGWEA